MAQTVATFPLFSSHSLLFFFLLLLFNMHLKSVASLCQQRKDNNKTKMGEKTSQTEKETNREEWQRF